MYLHKQNIDIVLITSALADNNGGLVDITANSLQKVSIDCVELYFI